MEPGGVAPRFGDGPSTVSESTVSNTELTEFFGPRRENSVSSSQPIAAKLTKANSPNLSQNSPSSPQNSVGSLIRNNALEAVFRPSPNVAAE